MDLLLLSCVVFFFLPSFIASVHYSYNRSFFSHFSECFPTGPSIRSSVFPFFGEGVSILFGDREINVRSAEMQAVYFELIAATRWDPPKILFYNA